MDVGSIDFRTLFTSFDGRINRLPFWIGVIIVAVISGVANYLVAKLLLPLGYWAIVIASIAIAVVLAYPALAVMIKRLHDRGKPGIFAVVFYGVPAAAGVLALLLPSLAMVFSVASLIVGLWALWELGIQAGTNGTNEFGRDPLAEERL